MPKTWLLLDCHYLAHRAFHALGGLEFQGALTGVVFGFLRDVVYLSDRFQTNHLVFAWDHGKGLREQTDSSYKMSRRVLQPNLSPAEADTLSSLQQQISDLKFQHLPSIGYRNVLFTKGYEADDIIASVCQSSLHPGEEAVIVSADKDLWQLLSPSVSVYNPQTKVQLTEKGFTEAWGIPPQSWPKVKAIAGCKSDDIPGMEGVGEITAAKFLRGKLNPKTKTFQRVQEGHQAWLNMNLPLVKLPYPGCPEFTLWDDVLSRTAWEKLAKDLGMKSLRDLFPSNRKGLRP